MKRTLKNNEPLAVYAMPPPRRANVSASSRSAPDWQQPANLNERGQPYNAKSILIMLV